MERRKFLKVGGVLAAAAAIPPVAVNVQSFMATAIQSIVKRELQYLKIDPEGLDQFTKDYINYLDNFSTVAQQKFRMNIASANLFKRDALNSPTIEGIVKRFLLSSDFFTNQMDEGKLVRYVGMHDRSKAACFNPFSHLYYSQAG